MTDVATPAAEKPKTKTCMACEKDQPASEFPTYRYKNQTKSHPLCKRCFALNAKAPIHE